MAPLASALLAFEAGGIAPERVDRLAGAPAGRRGPAAIVFLAATVLAVLVALLAAGAFVSGHPRVCLPLDAAPGMIACAVIARLIALGPAWLGWRRAGVFLRA